MKWPSTLRSWVMVPSGWKGASLGSFMEFRNGLNTDKSQYGKGLKFVNVMDVFGNDILTEKKIIGRVQVDEKRLKDNLLHLGDVLFNRTSETFNEIAMSAVYLDDAPAIFGGFVIRGRPENGILIPEFSAYIFQSTNFRTQVIKLGQGAVRANIGQKDLSNVSLLLPPLPEQKKIAQILSTWDQAIQTTEQLLANSQQQKKALMQQLLAGKNRFPGFRGKWMSGHLSDLAKIGKGKALSSKNLLAGHYPVVAGGKSSPYKHAEYTHENIITVSASGAYAGYVAYYGYKIWASDCSVVEAKKDNDIRFIFQLMLLNQQKIYSLQSGGAQPHIYPKDLNALKINVPPLAEQNKIATVLSAADREIKTIQQKLDLLKQEKKALMQQLLTGKQRVKL